MRSMLNKKANDEARKEEQSNDDATAEDGNPRRLRFEDKDKKTKREKKERKEK